MLETIDSLTVYDAMGEDHELEATLNPETKTVLVQITNESGNLVYQEDSHRYAWGSLVYLAKQILRYDEKIQQQLNDLEQ